MSVTIITNNQYRELLNWWDLTEKEQNELKDSYDNVTESQFFRYKNQIYDLSNFMRSSHFKGWDGYAADSFFSGLLIKFSYCDDAVKVGLYLS